MENRLYEITFIIDSQLEQKQIDEIVQKVENTITEAEGEIVKKELWGKRRLAYEMKKRQYGYYVYILFRAPGDLIRKMERDLRLNEFVLRFLTVKLSKAAIRQMEKNAKRKEVRQEEAQQPEVKPEETVEEVAKATTEEE